MAEIPLVAPPDEDFSEQEADPNFEWGWLTISASVTDGRGNEWLHTERYLYHSPNEVRAIFTQNIADNGWTIVNG